RANELRPGAPQLRDAAISALTLADVRETRRYRLPAGLTGQSLSGGLDSRFLADTNGIIHARKLDEAQDQFCLGTGGERIAALLPDSATGHWLYAWYTNGEIKVWNLFDQRPHLQLTNSTHLSISSDDRWLAELRTGQVYIHDLSSGTVQQFDAEGFDT